MYGVRPDRCRGKHWLFIYKDMSSLTKIYKLLFHRKFQSCISAEIPDLSYWWCLTRHQRGPWTLWFGYSLIWEVSTIGLSIQPLSDINGFLICSTGKSFSMNPSTQSPVSSAASFFIEKTVLGTEANESRICLFVWVWGSDMGVRKAHLGADRTSSLEFAIQSPGMPQKG